MIFLANLVTFGLMVALGFIFKEIEWTWGRETVVVFSLGWIAATVMWQAAHKMRYGHWFDPPEVRGATNAPGFRESGPAKLAGKPDKFPT